MSNYTAKITEIGRQYLRARALNIRDLPEFISSMRRVIEARAQRFASQPALPGFDQTGDNREDGPGIIMEALDLAAQEVESNTTPPRDLPSIVGALIDSLSGLTTTSSGSSAANNVHVELPIKPPAVPIDQSVHEDYLICLEDGERMAMLKRYLMRKYKMTPEQYRIRWGLPHDYPMVAPKYSARRSEVAKNSGLGKLPKTKPAA